MKINKKKSIILFILIATIFNLSFNGTYAKADNVNYYENTDFLNKEEATNDLAITNIYSVAKSSTTSSKKSTNLKKSNSSSGSTSKKNSKTSDTTGKTSSETQDIETHTVNSKDKTISNHQNTLKSLSVEDYDIYPEFNKNTTEYYVSIPKNVSKLNVNAVAEYDEAKIKISGNDALTKAGENLIKVAVTNKSSTKTYTIHTNRMENNGLKLSSLNIEGVSLNPNFDKDTYNYTAEIEENEIKPFNIKAVANQPNTQIEIIGNDEKLVKGDNLISIILDNGKDTSIYQIEVSINDKKFISSNNKSNGKLNSIMIGIQNIIFKNKINFFAFLAIIFIIILINILLIIKKVKSSNKNKKRQNLKKRAI